MVNIAVFEVCLNWIFLPCMSWNSMLLEIVKIYSYSSASILNMIVVTYPNKQYLRSDENIKTTENNVR